MPDQQEQRSEDLSPEDPGRNAMRAFLQRAEVRISTMQRIGGLFVSGAGLLFLFPVFFKDAFLEILRTCLTVGQPLSLLLFTVPLLIPAGVSLALPLYAFYRLLQDLVLFYFTPQHYGQNGKWFNPRFVLSGIAFSADESPAVKQSVLRAEREDPTLQNFVLSQHESHREPLRRIYEMTGQEIVSDVRRQPDDNSNRDSTLVNVAFALAGTVDRSLALEVAQAEASLVRHSVALRSLVLRYAKALLLFTWTTLVALLVAGTLHSLAGQNLGSLDSAHALPVGSLPDQAKSEFARHGLSGFALFQVVAVGILYSAWALVAPWLIQRPIKWIYELGDKNKSLKKADVDQDLFHFEVQVSRWCRRTLISWTSYWFVGYVTLLWVVAYLRASGWMKP